MGPTTPTQRAATKTQSAAIGPEKSIVRPLKLNSTVAPPDSGATVDRRSQEEQMITVVVSGSVFVVSPATLMRREADSMFARFIRSQRAKRSGGPSFDDIILDRDSKLFLDVLNYLRTGQVKRSKADPNTLLKEAEFYGMPGMVACVQQLIRQRSLPRLPRTPVAKAAGKTVGTCRQEIIRESRRPTVQQRKISQEDMFFDMDL